MLCAVGLCLVLKLKTNLTSRPVQSRLFRPIAFQAPTLGGPLEILEQCRDSRGPPAGFQEPLDDRIGIPSMGRKKSRPGLLERFFYWRIQRATSLAGESSNEVTLDDQRSKG